MIAASHKPLQPIRVLVVDDEPLFVDMVQALLASDERIVVVGTARDGREGVNRALELRPDVILMDISMPVLDGIEATRQIRERLPTACILMLTGSNIAAEVDRSRQAGAAAFLTKDRVGAELGGTILDVAGVSAAAGA